MVEFLLTKENVEFMAIIIFSYIKLLNVSGPILAIYAYEFLNKSLDLQG